MSDTSDLKRESKHTRHSRGYDTGTLIKQGCPENARGANPLRDELT
ncbi:MAG: hypothetical protein JW969_20890 [Spirochaetales bacterium]|nr:hypothetical protein [Spirochaetales bacterium]